jgi:hypothetical protein
MKVKQVKMTNEEAIKILGACKPVAERASGAFPSGLPLNYTLTLQDLTLLQDFARVQSDQVAAGPGLLKRLFTQAELTPVEIYKLEQLKRLVFKRRYLGQNVVNGSKLGSR